MKSIGIIFIYLVFRHVEIPNLKAYTSISDSKFDTLDVSIAINCDTNSYLINKYKDPFPCHQVSIPNCQLYKNKFLDTCFDLNDSDLQYIKTKTPESEFLLYSKYYKKYIFNQPNRKNKKVNFKGFKFCVYQCQLIVNKSNYRTENLTVPENKKHLVGLKNIVYIDSVRLIRN